MAEIKVSVIIPVFNMEKTLGSCLDNVLTQTLDGLEIICVDDGSTDSSKEILAAYEKKHRNIRVISQSNKGPGPARNAAMYIAMGKYIAFMDADDCYADCAVLEILYSYAEKEKVVICGGSLVLERDGTRHICDGYYRQSSFQNTGIVTYRDYQYAYGYQRFLFLTSFLREHKIQFPPYRRFQDPPFMVKAMICAQTFYAVAMDVYVYRSISKPFLLKRFDILNDMVRGIGDVLTMSEGEHLEKLHGDMIQKVLKHMCDCYKSIYRGNRELEESWDRLLQHVDDSLLRADGRYKENLIFKTAKEIKIYLNNIDVKEQRLWKKIGESSEVLIYGAGLIGKRLYEYMMQKNYGGTLEFVVTAPKPNEMVYEKEVTCIKEYPMRQKNILVLVAAAEENASVMIDYAYKLGFENIEKIDLGDIKLFQKWKLDLSQEDKTG